MPKGKGSGEEKPVGTPSKRRSPLVKLHVFSLVGTFISSAPRQGASNSPSLINTLPAPQLLDESTLTSKYGNKAGDDDIEKTQRKELVKGVTRGDESCDRLDKAYTMAQNSANAGDEILNRLQDQREKILSARCSAESMEHDMDTSERKMSRMACEKCIQRWILWVIAFMFIGGLLFFLYWKLEIEPDKHKNCHHDSQGKCIEGTEEVVEYDRDRRRARTGAGEEGSKLGKYEDAYAEGYRAAVREVNGDSSGGVGAYRRMLAYRAVWAAEEDHDTKAYLRYKAQGTLLW